MILQLTLTWKKIPTLGGKPYENTLCLSDATRLLVIATISLLGYELG